MTDSPKPDGPVPPSVGTFRSIGGVGTDLFIQLKRNFGASDEEIKEDLQRLEEARNEPRDTDRM